MVVLDRLGQVVVGGRSNTNTVTVPVLSLLLLLFDKRRGLLEQHSAQPVGVFTASGDVCASTGCDN